MLASQRDGEIAMVGGKSGHPARQESERLVSLKRPWAMEWVPCCECNRLVTTVIALNYNRQK